MEDKLKIMTIFGTRPEAIKMAPLIKELKKHHNKIETIVTVTGQHREMLDQVLQFFEIVPNYDLNVMQEMQTVVDITIRGLEGLNHVLHEKKPDIVLVHGDTTTTFTAGLASFYHKIRIGHVEAGLRSMNKFSPYPEEINRRLTSVLADFHFAPTKQAKMNLIEENISEASIFVTGNTAIDALKTTVKSDYHHPVLDQLGNDRLLLLTAHRRENIGTPLENLMRSIRRIVEKHQDVQVVFPIHMNPIIRDIAKNMLGRHDRIHQIEPLDVLDFHNFAARAHLIVTDSGGVQEEAPFLGVPVLVTRNTTERPEGITAGTMKLAGTNEEQIFQMADELLTDKNAHDKMAKAVNPYGDGNASKRIVEALLYKMGYSDVKTDEFS